MLSAICFNSDQSKILSSIYGLNTLNKRTLENTNGKGEPPFSLFPTIFSTYRRQKSSFNPLPNDKIFQLLYIERICRPKHKCEPKIEISFGMGRKHCGKRRERWLPAFSLFLKMFSKASFLRVLKNQDCVVKDKEFLWHHVFSVL